VTHSTVTSRLPFAFFARAARSLEDREHAREFVALCELVERARGGCGAYQIPWSAP
jgi:hypothetical protein